MSTKFSLFKVIDRFLFTRLDELKETANFQKLISETSNLGEKEYKLASYSASLALILAPFVFVLVIYFSNISLKNKVEMKNDIYKYINSYMDNKRTMEKVERSFISPTSFTTKIALEQKISSILIRNNITPGSIIVEKFELLDTKTKITQIKAELSFDGLGLSELSSILLSLLEQEKAKIQGISINKDTKTQLLNGSIDILHYGRAQNQ